jgi:hypothetical protein
MSWRFIPRHNLSLRKINTALKHFKEQLASDSVPKCSDIYIFLVMTHTEIGKPLDTHCWIPPGVEDNVPIERHYISDRQDAQLSTQSIKEKIGTWGHTKFECCGTAQEILGSHGCRTPLGRKPYTHDNFWHNSL